MKRIFSALLAAAILWMSAIPCLTGAASMIAPGSVDIGVHARAVHTAAPHYYEAPPVDGEYSVTTGDGTTITVIPEPLPSGWRLVVYEITANDAQAYGWFSSCTSHLGNPRKYFEIYFVDAAGNRADQVRASAHISWTSETGMDAVYSLAANGTVSQVSSRSANGGISFSISRGGYYVFAAKSGSTSATDPTDSGENGNPGTGDESHLQLWVGIMLLSAMGCIGMADRARRKETM